MTATPIRALIDDRSPTKSCAGRSPVAPNPIAAAKLASLRAAKPPSDVDPPVPNASAALSQRENTLPRPLAAARPIAKSPLAGASPTAPLRPAVSSLGGFRTPAPSQLPASTPAPRPASKTLHRRIRLFKRSPIRAMSKVPITPAVKMLL